MSQFSRTKTRTENKVPKLAHSDEFRYETPPPPPRPYWERVSENLSLLGNTVNRVLSNLAQASGLYLVDEPTYAVLVRYERARFYAPYRLTHILF